MGSPQWASFGAGAAGALANQIAMAEADRRQKQRALEIISHQINEQQRVKQEALAAGGLFDLETGAMGRRSAAAWGPEGYEAAAMLRKGEVGDTVKGFQFGPEGSARKGMQFEEEMWGEGAPASNTFIRKSLLEKKYGRKPGGGKGTSKPVSEADNYIYTMSQYFLGELASGNQTASTVEDEISLLPVSDDLKQAIRGNVAFKTQRNQARSSMDLLQDVEKKDVKKLKGKPKKSARPQGPPSNFPKSTLGW